MSRPPSLPMAMTRKPARAVADDVAERLTELLVGERRQ